MSGKGGIVGLVLLALGAGVVLAQDQAGFDFMPQGGRSLAVEVFGNDPAELSELASLALDSEGWTQEIARRDPSLSGAEVQTLASYLSLNLPLYDAQALATLEPAAAAEALPLDGKDLAIRHCQGCHGFYSGYLGHEREVNGWLVMFNSPFHMEIRMDATERRTFAEYSALNLPMKIEDVPPELRF